MADISVVRSQVEVAETRIEVVGLPAVGVLIEVADLLLVLVLVEGFLPFVGVPTVVGVVGFLAVGILVDLLLVAVSAEGVLLLVGVVGLLAVEVPGYRSPC